MQRVTVVAKRWPKRELQLSEVYSADPVSQIRRRQSAPPLHLSFPQRYHGRHPFAFTTTDQNRMISTYFVNRFGPLYAKLSYGQVKNGSPLSSFLLFILLFFLLPKMEGWAQGFPGQCFVWKRSIAAPEGLLRISRLLTRLVTRLGSKQHNPLLIPRLKGPGLTLQCGQIGLLPDNFNPRVTLLRNSRPGYAAWRQHTSTLMQPASTAPDMRA